MSGELDLVVVEVTPDDGGCLLTLTQLGMPEGTEEPTRNGWGKMFATLVAALGEGAGSDGRDT